ncbi:hypothetical protein IFM89_001946 [Coptis chinensis]|uniref:Uncharacterized protein n=1 Tax=Coptis chinensis TaxID=261450 RepID=A0A835IT64_9MAGN|nr:hypothetical protein IFM89_001946 [Coptis chinensis]
MGSMKRIVFMTWERRLTGEGNVVSLGRVQQKKAINWWDGLAAVRRLLWRFKSQWRQFGKSNRNSIRFSYDLYSYCQNFDDGILHHLSTDPTS